MVQVSIFLHILIIACGVMLAAFAWPYRRKPEATWLIILSAAMVMTSYFCLGVYTSDAKEDMVFFSRLRYFGFAWMSVSALMFVSGAFGGWDRLRRGPLLYVALIIPIITSVISLNPYWQHLMQEEFEIVMIDGHQLLKFTTGAWFPIHMTYALVMNLLIGVYSLWRLRDLTPLQRPQILLIMSSGLLGMAVDMYCVITNSPMRWAMVSGGTYLLGLFSVLYSVLKYGLLNISPIAKDIIFQQSPDPVLILNDRELLQDYNESAQRVFHLSPADCDRPWSTLKSRLFLDDPGNKEWELRRHHPDEPPRFFSVGIQSLGERALKPGQILAFREVTQQKNIEKNLQNHLDFKARLLSIIAHDFSGYLEAQRLLSSYVEKNATDDLRPQAEALSDAVFVSRDFMANVMMWAQAQIQETRFQPRRIPFEMNALVRDVIAAQNGLRQLRQVELDFQPGLNPAIILGDSIMIESVVRNLASNAIRVSARGARIRIFTRQRQNDLIFEIADEGPGLSAEQIEKIRASANSFISGQVGESFGFGLGLMIVQKFLELHESRLEIDSRLGQGTSMSFRLSLDTSAP